MHEARWCNRGTPSGRETRSKAGSTLICRHLAKVLHEREGEIFLKLKSRGSKSDPRLNHWTEMK